MLSEFFTKRFGLTKEGSDNLIKGIFYTALLNISFMFPVGLYALLIYLWVEQLTVGEIIDPNLGIFILLILIVLGIILPLHGSSITLYSIQHMLKVETEESTLVRI